MAYSASVKRSQDIIVCGLCEKDSKVKVKCMDCDLYLCQTCKEKGHAKFKNADLHDVVALKDIHSHEAKSEFKPVQCEEHVKQYSCMYCLTCEQLVCPICISKTHHKHDMGEMETIFKNKFTQVQGFRQKVENQMEEVLEKLGLLQESKEKDENLIKELQKIEESFEKKDTKKFIDGTRNFQSDMEKFNNSISIFEKLLENIPKSVVKDITFKKKGKYKTSHLYYHLISITSDEDGKLWIADGDQCIKQLEITDGVNAVNSYKIEGDINEIRCLNKNKIYFTSSTQILCLIRKNTIKMLKDFTPNKVFTIHISKGDEIIVGMDLHETERSDDQPVIIRLDFDGKIIQVYKNSGGQLLTRDIVQCCTTFKDGTICYLDNPLFAENTFGGVVHIDKNGIIQWKYIGNPFIDCEDQPFSPIEVITTPSNNLIISDKFVGALHILTSKGTLLTFLDLKSIGIYTPSVMTMDIHGTLWIKSREKEIQFLNAVKCSGL
ncbi:Hypothetical predicted protein [Mytilus galloprovincialis]|uniref:B box-type domain-containing protein n=1 Tax=Mytilus galloprovincialis TaxID=29158 RepID=A0A8B6E0H3_MYTGA|nr:Hypothetical predicted protein [Mytilus galloprovincialis]